MSAKSKMSEATLEALQCVCLRCVPVYKWLPRGPGIPKQCPQCKSRLWMKPKVAKAPRRASEAA